MEKTAKIWLLYDGRYRADKNRATCFEVCDSLKEAKTNVGDYGSDTVIVEADRVGKEIKNHKIIN